MGSRGIGVFLTIAALAFAGCGDDDDSGDTGNDGGGTDTAAGQAAPEQDATAKSDARTLVTYVEVCFADQATYAGCEEAAAGEDVGEATVESATDAAFVIVSPSESGTEFRIEKTGAGALERTCDAAGEGGCGADGTW